MALGWGRLSEEHLLCEAGDLILCGGQNSTPGVLPQMLSMFVVGNCLT